MFEAYTPLDRRIGKEIRVRVGGEEYTGLLAGIYTVQNLPMVVITPLSGGGTEHHIALSSAVVTIKHDRM